MRERWGPTFSLQSANGDVVVTGEPALVREIFAASEEQVRPFAMDAAVPVLGERSVLTTSGDVHRRSRRLLMPALAGDSMRALGPRMRAIAHAHCARWPQQGTFRAHDALLDISLQIIVETVLGAHAPDEIRETRHHTARVTEEMHPVLLFSPLFQFGLAGLSPWDRFRAARQRFEDNLASFIAARRTAEGGAAPEHRDLLTTLLAVRDEDGTAMDDDELLQQLLALLVAGHETTAIAMAWALYWLHRTPDALARAREEVDAAGDVLAADLSALPWLTAVIRETLRLWPIVPDVLRSLKTPFSLGEWHLPAGHNMAAAAAMTHMDPDLYPDPDAFRPERFLDWQPRPWEWYPFGGGIRRCVGASFATFEMAQVLGVVLATCILEPTSDAEVLPVRRNITLGPRGGIPMRCRPRHGGQA